MAIFSPGDVPALRLVLGGLGAVHVPKRAHGGGLPLGLGAGR